MISTLVSALPEIYQPIYGYPDLSNTVSRSCDDRLIKIAECYDLLHRELSRPLKVLDLGCAQGYFSLSLGEHGAIVHGVDFLDKNIAVCKALAEEQPEFELSFDVGRVEDILDSIYPGQYDIILGLSVFHHIIHEKGIDYVKQLIVKAADVSLALIVELALHEEPVYWGASQPGESRYLLDSVAFVHEIARFSTHLSEILRPMYVASNRYWLLGDSVGEFESWTVEPHALAKGVNQKSRRYFFSAKHVIKFYSFNHKHRGDFNKCEFQREQHFFNNLPPNYQSPKCHLLVEYENEGWVVMERLPGRLLVDRLRAGEKVDHYAVILAVLNYARILEEVGLYHNDIRSWNVLIADNGEVYLIDYGAIIDEPHDCVWPHNIYIAFMMFVDEVVRGRLDKSIPLRTGHISPFSLPQPYLSWAISLWNTPMIEWSFKLMYDTLNKVSQNSMPSPVIRPIDERTLAMEQVIQVHSDILKTTEDQVSQCNQRAAQIEALARNAIERSEELENRISRLQPKFWVKRIRTVGKQGLRRVLVPIVLKIREYPMFYRVITSPLDAKPKLRRSLKRNIFGKPGKVYSWASKAEREVAVRQLLSSRALEVYDKLTKAIESTKRSGDK